MVILIASFRYTVLEYIFTYPLLLVVFWDYRNLVVLGLLTAAWSRPHNCQGTKSAPNVPKDYGWDFFGDAPRGFKHPVPGPTDRCSELYLLLSSYKDIQTFWAEVGNCGCASYFGFHFQQPWPAQPMNRVGGNCKQKNIWRASTAWDT